ncbi:MAG: hypothetical protein M3R27_08345 [Bacteroidota bacterium]|nr:hypothetical protein [Bacteroidota bacterium]
MKDVRTFIENYLLQGAYSFALFGVYALTISPIIDHFFEFGKPNAFLAIFGFGMLIAEFFALKFKLNIIRVRTQLKRIEYKKQTGIDIIPSITPGVLFGFFARLVFHVGIIMICMTALGYECSERKMSTEGVIAIMTGFILEMAALIYLYMNFDLYTDPPLTKKALREELKEDDEWNAVNLEKELAAYSYKKELAATIVLQVFSCMLFTSFWHFINKRGMEILGEFYNLEVGAFWSLVMLFPVMVSTIVIGLMPMQISHWIENSLQAFSHQAKRKGWIIFITVGIFVCAPTIIKYFELYVFRTGDRSLNFLPEYMQYLLTLILFIVILVIEIRMLEKEKPEEILKEDEVISNEPGLIDVRDNNVKIP